jgi:hypothetical protein
MSVQARKRIGLTRQPRRKPGHDVSGCGRGVAGIVCPSAYSLDAQYLSAAEVAAPPTTQGMPR